MWGILRTLIANGILAKTILRSAGWLTWLLPLGFLLQWIGWPLLGVLGVLAVPVLILLMIIGLPIFIVITLGGLLMSAVGVLLTAGIAVLKIAIPVLIILWLWRHWSGAAAAPASTASPHSPDSPPR